MRAVGYTSGIGSLLIGAREAGFEIVGNVEWRPYYRVKDPEGRNTFTENFPGAFMERAWDGLIPAQLNAVMECDLLMAHPDCGPYSVLSGANFKGKSANEYAAATASDIPILVEGISRIRPRFFVSDNLPRSLLGFTMREWHAALPDYDLFPEWVSNYHYGNVQKNRRRLFMIGALREEHYVFVPGERGNLVTLRDVMPIEKGTLPNDENHVLDASLHRGRGIVGPDHMTFREAREFLRTFPCGKSIPYVNKRGEMSTHIGVVKSREDYCSVIHGGWPTFNPWTCLPFSIRERARIQGIPDSFVFYGTRLEPDGTWNHARNAPMVKQTGKCMPVQFAEYVSKQIAAHIAGHAPPDLGGKREINPSPIIDEAKRWYCGEVGYGDTQGDACVACGVSKCPSRR